MQGPRLYRFFNYEAIAYLPAPVAGWNPDANPWELPDTQAPILDNALIRPGRVSVRGALTNWADLSSITTPAPPLNVCGVQPQPGTTKVAIGRKAVSATAYVDPWFAPIVRPTTAAKIAAPTADLAVALGATAFTNTATAADLIPGPRGIDFEGTRYYISYGTSTSPVQDAGSAYYAQTTNLCTLTTAGTFTALTNAPRGFIDVKGYQSRLWGLGGIDDPGSGTTFNALYLFFTNPIAAGGGNAAGYADWKDPVENTTNKILMDGDTTDPGVGLALVRNGLLILRYQSIWLLKGSTTANYTLIPIAQDTGCIDPRSIVETDEGVYFMSRQGLMLTNGTTLKNVSGPVQYTLQNAVEIVVASIKSSFGGYITSTVASGGQIIISLGVPSVTAGAPDGHIQPVWCAMFDVATNSWTRITSELFASDGNIIVSGNNYPGWVFSTPDRRVLSIGDKYITQWEAEAGSSSVSTLSATEFDPAFTPDVNLGASNPWALMSGSTLTVTMTGGHSGPYYSDGIQCTGYGFSIPSSATITGVQVTALEADTMSPGGVLAIKDNSVKLVKAGTPVGTDHANSSVYWPPATPANVVYGGPTDLWGTTLTPADVNNTGFGVIISAINSGPPGADTASLNEFVAITVSYTLPSVVQQQSFVKQPALYDTDAAGNFQPIPFVWRTKLLPVITATTTASKRNFAQLKRVMIDYVFQGVGLPSTNGFTVTPKDALDAIISGGSPLVLPVTNNSMTSSSISGGQPNASTSIQRVNQDLWSEISDVCWEVVWVDAQQSTNPSYVAAEIYGVGVEFQHARELR